jgi:hypothetical protein
MRAVALLAGGLRGAKVGKNCSYLMIRRFSHGRTGVVAVREEDHTIWNLWNPNLEKELSIHGAL